MTEKIINEHPFKKYWRPAAATVYLIICIFDFIIMPSIIEISNTKITNQQAITLALKFNDSASQMQSLSVFMEKRTWNPLTLLGSGFFHLSFGALLTGSAITRGLEKKQHASNGKVMK